MPDAGRILLADDEETVLGATAALLENEGFVCDTVSNARAAIENLGRNEYDVMIADWKMPGNAELELVKAIPNLVKVLPVILVTGYPKLPATIQRAQAQVYAHLMKPFEFEDLLAVVRAAVEYCRERRAGISS
jgi:DNA-binding NtrC family response regulator